MYDINALPATINIGRQLENGVTEVLFDISPWIAAHPTIVCTMTMVSPSGGSPFPLSGISQLDNILTWVVGNDATENNGTGTIVIHGTVGSIEKRSSLFYAIVQNGHEASGEAPAEIQDWLTEVVSKKKGKATSKQIAAYADCKTPTAKVDFVAEYLGLKDSE